MKAYKRQNIAMFALVASIAMSGTSVFAASTSISPSDITSKPIVTKMQKSSIASGAKDSKAATVKKSLKKKKAKKVTTPTKIITKTVQ